MGLRRPWLLVAASVLLLTGCEAKKQRPEPYYDEKIGYPTPVCRWDIKGGGQIYEACPPNMFPRVVTYFPPEVHGPVDRPMIDFTGWNASCISVDGNAGKITPNYDVAECWPGGSIADKKVMVNP
jgi:hypothetical protein